MAGPHRVGADYWCHLLFLRNPGYEIDVIEMQRPLHVDRWLEIFYDAVDGGWTGPHAEHAKKRATHFAAA